MSIIATALAAQTPSAFPPQRERAEVFLQSQGPGLSYKGMTGRVTADDKRFYFLFHV